MPPDVARISTDFVHGDPIFVKKALAMAFGVGSVKVVMAFDPGSAMTITALSFLIAIDFLTTIGFNVLNASVASLNACELFSAKRLGQTAPQPFAPTSPPPAPPVLASLNQLYVLKVTASAGLVG